MGGKTITPDDIKEDIDGGDVCGDGGGDTDGEGGDEEEEEKEEEKRVDWG